MTSPSDQKESNPYVGPRAFEEKEKDLFFGRDRESNQMVSLILSNRLALIYSQSGAGKTSIFNAKVLPALKKKGFQVLKSVCVRSFLVSLAPANVKNTYVFNTLQSLSGAKDISKLRKKTLSRFLRGYPRERSNVDESTVPKGAPIPRVIVFDQFEELFNLDIRDMHMQRLEFFRQIVEALNDDILLRVVLVMREEYLAQLDTFQSLFGESIPSLRLKRLDKKSAFLAVTEPLKKIETTRTFAPGVADTLVDNLSITRVDNRSREVTNVKGEYVQPVHLQVVCYRMWEELPNNATQITRYDVKEVDVALREFYEEAIRNAGKKNGVDEADIRRWFEKYLITSTGTRSVVHQGIHETGGLSNKVVSDLESGYLIRSEWRLNARWYELTHDRLLGPIKESNREFFQQKKLKDKYKTERFDQFISNVISKTDPKDDIQIDDAYLDQADVVFKNVEDNSARASTLAAKGNLFFMREDYVKAIECFRQALELDSFSLRAYDGLARAYWGIGNLAEARVNFDREIELDPGSFFLYGYRGQVLAEMEEYKDAIKDLSRSIEMGKSFGRDAKLNIAYARSGLGLAYGKLGDYKRADQEFKDSISDAPNNAGVYYNMALINIDRNQVDQAITDFIESLNKYNPPLIPYKQRIAKDYLDKHL